MKKLIIVVLLLFTGIVYGQVGVGISIGAPPPPRVEVVPAQPGPDFTWIEGYWYPVRGRYKWHRGYWSRPPYEGARWIAPRHDGRLYHEGYWEGNNGRVAHNHGWDKHRDRDYHHEGERH